MHEQAGGKSEENFRLSREVIGQTKRFNEMLIKFEKLDLALREISEEKSQSSDPEVEDIKDKRIEELSQEVTRLLGVIEFKNHLLSILDKDIYTIGKNYQIQGEAG